MAVLSLLCFKNRHKMHMGNFGGHSSMSTDIDVEGDVLTEWCVISSDHGHIYRKGRMMPLQIVVSNSDI